MVHGSPRSFLTVILHTGGWHQKSCTRQDFCAQTSGHFPIVGLGLSLAGVQDFWCQLPYDIIDASHLTRAISLRNDEPWNVAIGALGSSSVLESAEHSLPGMLQSHPCIRNKITGDMMPYLQDVGIICKGPYAWHLVSRTRNGWTVPPASQPGRCGWSEFERIRGMQALQLLAFTVVQDCLVLLVEADSK